MSCLFNHSFTLDRCNNFLNLGVDSVTRLRQHKYSTVQYSSCRATTVKNNYRKGCNIRRTKFQNLNDSRPVLQLSLPNLLKPCIKSRMKM